MVTLFRGDDRFYFCLNTLNQSGGRLTVNEDRIRHCRQSILGIAQFDVAPLSLTKRDYP